MANFTTVFKSRTATIESLSASNVPLTITGISGHTGNLTDWQVNGTTLGFFSPKGQLMAFGPTGSDTNTAFGFAAMNSNASATNCVAIGSSALNKMTGGPGQNICIGVASGRDITTGDSILAIGHLAGFKLTEGRNNVAIGNLSMISMTGTPSTTSQNTAIGHRSMQSRVGSLNSTAIGYSAMATGDCSFSVAIGNFALQNSNGANSRSVGIGYGAGSTQQNGANNVFIGHNAGQTSGNTLGDYSDNVIIGYAAGDNITTGASNNIVIGSNVDLPVAGGSNYMNIGNVIYGHDISGASSKVSINYIETNASYGFGVASRGVRFRDEANTRDVFNFNCISGALTFDLSRALISPQGTSYMQHSTTRFGIGTTSPTAFLHLKKIASVAPFRIEGVASAPTSQQNGDFYYNNTDLHFRHSSTDYQFAFKNRVQAFTQQQYFAETTLTDAANIAWDLDDNQTSTVTLAGNRTLDNPTNMKAGATYILKVVQGGTGSYTLAYGTAYKFQGGVAPTLSTAIGAVDILRFYSDGTNMYGVSELDFS
jgi:hypothetical protein